MRALLASLILFAACSSDTLPSTNDAAVDPPPFDSRPLDVTATHDLPSPADLCTGADNDSRNCGACGYNCCGGNFCTGGRCVVGCGQGLTACPQVVDAGGCHGGICVDTRSDNMNCGGCNLPCAPGATCISGACADPK